MAPIPGIHHVTAIAGDPAGNVAFYAGVLGMRLVKKTVNFDDPGSYHLYYGDESGSPGTITTFFPWPGARRGRWGTGQVGTVSFAAPQGSLAWWSERLKQHGVKAERGETLGEERLAFEDPDGLRLEIATPPAAHGRPWSRGPVPEEHALRGFARVTLAVADHEGTAALLTEAMGFRPVAESSQRFRFAAGDGIAAQVDVLEVPDAGPGRIAVGNVHHVAWRAPSEAEQLGWRERLADHGVDVTPVLDRQYFRSVYFREPGGVLFEIATDPPGFATDEAPDQLGTALKLPPWLEPQRARIEAVLPPLGEVPGHVR